MPRALFIGRFQPFHKGHLAVLLKLLRQYDEVVVVIGSAEQTMTFANPLTAGERIDMIRSCFSPAQLSRLLLLPVRDIDNHNLWVAHLCSYAPEFDAVYSNNELVRLLFSKQGVRVRSFDLVDRMAYQGTILREKILKGKAWQSDVPTPVARYLKLLGLQGRLQTLFMAAQHHHGRN